MKISKETTIELTPEEAGEIIRNYLKESQGLNVRIVSFRVNGFNREDDWRAEFPLDYRLDKVICTTIE